MEVKIGVVKAPREVAFESDDTPQDVKNAVSEAVEKGTLLQLTDSKGSLILVPGAAIGYVEIGSQRRAGVGFGSL